MTLSSDDDLIKVCIMFYHRVMPPKVIDKMQQRPKVIVLTGNMASGKTTATNILKKMGEQVLSADQIVHGILKEPACAQKILKQLKIFNPKFTSPKTVNYTTIKNYIRESIFLNLKFKNWYLRWIHAQVSQDLQDCINAFRLKSSGKLFVDIPLYFESAYVYKGIDYVWLIWTPKQLRYARWKARKAASYEKMKKIEKWQIKDEDKFKKVDMIFVNTLKETELCQQISKVLQLF